jgi:hypothetical protein
MLTTPNLFSVLKSSTMHKAIPSLFLLMLLSLSGCLHTPSALQIPKTAAELSDPDTAANETLTEEVVLSRAQAIDDQKSLEQSIALHWNYMSRQTPSRELLNSLSNQIILLADAYTPDRRTKRKLFLEAVALSEHAMKMNPDFLRKVEAGARTWEAVDSLHEEDMEAMLFWVTGLLYIFKDGMIPGEQIFNSAWISRAVAVLERMEAIDRTWRGGAVLFSRSIVYAAVPGALGGNKQKAREILDEAVNLEGDWMLPRWGRARYFHTATKDREAFIQDLEYVLATEVELPGEAPYWRRFFQADARNMLDQQQKWFR